MLVGKPYVPNTTHCA